MLSFFHYFFNRIVHSCLFENDFGFMSNKCCTPLCKGTAQYDAISWKDVTMLGISCYRKNYDCIRHVLEGLKTDVWGHAETCLPIICSNLGCFVFPLIFLGGCPNHEKINETCPLGWDPENKDFSSGQVWLVQAYSTKTTWGRREGGRKLVGTLCLLIIAPCKEQSIIYI